MQGGRVAGVQDLEVHKGAELKLHPDAKINSYNASLVNLRSLSVFGSGLVTYHGLAEQGDQLHVTLEEKFHIKGGGLVKANYLILESKSNFVLVEEVIKGKVWYLCFIFCFFFNSF